jgi:DNA-binding Xre family transcriptional regulator
MKITEKLDQLMDKKGIKNKYQLAQLSGVPYTTIAGFYKKGGADVRRSTLIKLARFFDCSLDYLANNDITDINYGKSDGFAVDYNEMQYITKYRALDSHGKELVDTILGKEYRRIQATTPATVEEQVSYDYGVDPLLKAARPMGAIDWNKDDDEV